MTIENSDMPNIEFNQGCKQIKIRPPNEFNFAETLCYLNRSTAECMHMVRKERLYKLLQVGKRNTIIEIREEEGDVYVQLVWGTFESVDSYKEISNYVVDWFDLRKNLRPFYKLTAKDPLLGNLTQEFHGLRVIGIPDLFEALCWSVIGQQVNLSFAYTVKRRFVEAYGKRVKWDTKIFWLFPQPADIFTLTVENLRKLQFTQRKAEYIIGIAELMTNGALTKASLLKDYETAEKKLLSIRGIGPWSAHYVMMRCLRNPSALPIEDAGLQNALKKLLGRQKKPDPKEIRTLFTAWPNWEAYIVFYLWRSLSTNYCPKYKA